MINYIIKLKTQFARREVIGPGYQLLKQVTRKRSGVLFFRSSPLSFDVTRITREVGLGKQFARPV